MKLFTIDRDGEELVCVENAAGLLSPMSYPTMNDLLRDDSHRRDDWLAQAAAARQGLDPAKVRLLAPIPHPAQDILCLGMNYRRHKAEAEQFDPDAFTRRPDLPVYFSKRATRCPGPGEDIPGHFDLVDSLDYEAELAVILGRAARSVSPEEAADCVFGYTVLNDVSARNLQTGHKQWYFGKSLDGFAPMGPCIVTREELGFPPARAIRTWVNGELRQDAVTDQLIFPVAHLISALSQGMTLAPGTIIATGTPAGVGMGFDPPKFLSPGDEVTCAIEGIGALTNRFL